MREILFRGKTQNGRWVYGSLIKADDYCCILESEENVHPMDYPYLDDELGTIDGKATPVIQETVGQFTGLLDKNGEKIFEGDIVSLTHLTPNPTWDYTSVIGIVHWCGGAFEVEGVENDDYTPYGWLHDSCEACREIIGNVYDNPKLLEVSR